jgi:pyridoxamine 5'-phosphate oxidase
LDKDPVKQFQLWFDEASASGVPLPEAACLSTVSREGEPEGRMILLKEADERGFVFYTNFNSPKARSLQAHPLAALTFYWEKLRRQVRLVGKTEKVSDAEADAYFDSRPRESQLGAWASFQSEILDARETLEKRFEELSRKYEGKDIPRPAHWSGYRIVPAKIEFWIERPNRLHDRFLYELKGKEWVVTRLNP